MRPKRVAHTLFDRGKKICSDFPDSEKEKEHVAKALQSNAYPRRLVMKNWQPPPRSQLPEQDPPTATVTLPYVRHLSETIWRTLAPLGTRTSFWPHRTLWQTLVRLKDHIPLQQRAGVVYRILCGSCITKWRMIDQFRSLHCLKRVIDCFDTPTSKCQHTKDGCKSSHCAGHLSHSRSSEGH